MSHVVYMPVENEGSDCWRPVHADHVEGDVYEITVLEAPGEEEWRFLPGSRVRCSEKIFSDGQRGLVAFELATVD